MFKTVKDILAVVVAETLTAGTQGRSYVKFEEQGLTVNLKESTKDGSTKMNVRVTALSDAGEDLVDELIDEGILSDGNQYTHGYVSFEAIAEEDVEECRDLYTQARQAHRDVRNGVSERKGPDWMYEAAPKSAKKAARSSSRRRRRGGSASESSDL